MSKLASNLKYLRKKEKLSQGELADEFAVARTTMGDYERGKTEPNLEMLVKISTKFNVPIHDLILSDLSFDELEITRNDGLRVLAISVDQNNKENIELVDTKAEAGYLDSFNDPEYIRELPKISFPNIPQGTFRGFEIHGDSMLPMESGSIVICSFVEHIHQIKDNKTYILVSKESGLVYKRIKNIPEQQKLFLTSDNEAYLPYEIEYSDIAEIWQYYAHLSFSDAKSTFNYILEEKLADIQKKVTDLHNSMV
ncbi:MAG: helix-turn-helix domain-containing protein [Saprospiraceae bacterium]|nr:helix-turn-helix domain-containing protein [Saprospiraceae bacterium]